MDRPALPRAKTPFGPVLGRLCSGNLVLWLALWCGGCQQWQSLGPASSPMGLPPIDVVTYEGFPSPVPVDGRPLTIDSVLMQSDAYALTANVTLVAAAAQDPGFPEKQREVLKEQPDCVTIQNGPNLDVIVLDTLALTSLGKQGVPVRGTVAWIKFRELDLRDPDGVLEKVDSLTVLMNDTGEAVRYEAENPLTNYVGVISQLIKLGPEKPLFRDFVRRGDVLIIRRFQEGRLLSIYLPMPPPDPASNDDPTLSERLDWETLFPIAPLSGDVLEVAWSDDLVRRNPPQQSRTPAACHNTQRWGHDFFRCAGSLGNGISLGRR